MENKKEEPTLNKVTFVNGVQIKTEEDSTPANIRRVCENSLRNLGVETLGMFYQHRIDPNTPIEAVA